MIRKMTMLMAPEAAPAVPAAPPQATPAPVVAAPPVAAPPVATPPAAPAPTVLTPPAPVAAEFKVTFPEGFTLDEKRSTAFTDLAKKHGLKSEQAQDLVNFYVEGEKTREAQQLQMITKWGEDVKADPEIGGANFDANVGLARKALDRVGTPALKELLAVTGIGNHKEVVRLFAKIGKSISEDKLPGGKIEPGPAEPSLEQQMSDAFPASPGMFSPK